MEDPTPGPLRILVAEDVDEVRILAAELLRGRGHEVLEARSGTEASDALDRATFDVVLMDVVMPGVDGLEVTKRLRGSEDGERRTAVLAFTAGGRSARPERCLEAGMDAFLRKPVNGPVLIETVERFGSGKDRDAPGGALPTSLLHLAAEGDPDHLAELARVFLEFAPLQLRELRIAAAADDGASMAEWARKLRGSARVFRADGIQIPAERLEFLGGRGITDGVDPLVDLVADEVEVLERALKRVLEPRK